MIFNIKKIYNDYILKKKYKKKIKYELSKCDFEYLGFPFFEFFIVKKILDFDKDNIKVRLKYDNPSKYTINIIPKCVEVTVEDLDNKIKKYINDYYRIQKINKLI